MARIEVQDGDEMINVTFKVGKVGGKSVGVPDDVMCVQALLKFNTQFTRKWATVAAPEPSGILCRNTQQLIYDYQEFVRRRGNQGHVGFWVAKDGCVSPAVGNALLAKQVYTIVALNGDAGMVAAALKLEDHVNAICHRWPQVGFVLGRV